MKSFSRMFGSFALAAVLLSSQAAIAATPVQGTSDGGGYVTVKVDKSGHIVGAFVADITSWNSTVSLSSGTAAALKAAVVGQRNCITGVDLSGVAATTAISISVLDGVTAKYTVNMLAGGVRVAKDFPTPICGTANTALNVQLSGAPTGAVQANAQGYTVP